MSWAGESESLLLLPFPLFSRTRPLIYEIHSDDFIPIPGTKKLKYLEENAAAVAVHLTPEEEAEVRRTIESMGGSKGDRYPPAMMARLFGDSPELPK